MKNEISQLDLSKVQKERLKVVLQDSKQQKEAIKNDASLTQEQKVAKMRQMKKDEKQKISDLLTPEQRTKAKEYQENRKENMDHDGKMDHDGDNKMRHNGDKNVGKDYKKEMNSLDLSESQKNQMKTNMEEAQQQREAIKNDASLTPVQKKEKLKEVNKNSHSQIEKILTPAQRAKAKADKKRKMDVEEK